MLAIDILICGLLAVAVVVWWYPRMRRREWLLATLAIGVAITSVAAFFAYRWQAGVATATSAIFLLALLVGYFRPRTLREGLTFWLSGVTLSAASVASMLAFYWFPIIDLPEPTGPYKVGVHDFELTDDLRTGVHAIAPDEPRRLAVRVWYPAKDTVGYDRIPYLSALEAQTTARELGEVTPLGPMFFPYLRYSQTNSYRGAPIAEHLDDLPVVMFSHGYRGFKGQNTMLMEHLASHGYLAFAVQHTYDSVSTVFPNGDVVPMDPALVEYVLEYRERLATEGYAQEVIDVWTNPDLAQRRAAHLARNELPTSTRLVRFSAQVWVDDRVFVLDALQRGSVPYSVADVVALGNYDRIGSMGMSFGGSAACAMCMVDRRCAVVVNVDGEDRHAITFNRNMTAPMLSYRTDVRFYVQRMPGGEDEEGQNLVDFSYERHETAGLRPDLYRFRMTDVSHYMATDFGVFLRRNGNPFTESLFGYADGAEVNHVSNDIVRGFLDKHLRDGVDHSDGEFPEAQFTKHAAYVERHDTAHVREWWLTENPQDRTVRVVFETALGEWALALYPERAPNTVADFLSLVDAGGFDGLKIASGSTSSKLGTEVGVVSLPSTHLEASAAEASTDVSADSDNAVPQLSGIGYEHGVVAYDPGTDGMTAATWIIHLGESGRLRYSGIADEVPAEVGPLKSDDPIPFGRVLYGLHVLEGIQRGTLAKDRDSDLADRAVKIVRAYRVD